MKKLKICLAVVLSLTILGVGLLPLSAAPEQGTIKVNGEVYDGTFSEAVDEAMSLGWTHDYPVPTVAISGTVNMDRSIGSRTGTESLDYIRNIIIKGEGENAKLVLKAVPEPGNMNKGAIIIRGTNVTISDLTIDAYFNSYYALSFYDNDIIWDTSIDKVDANYVSGCVVENVKAINGTIAGIEIRKASHILFENVEANNNRESGIMFESIGYYSRINFIDCSTTGNNLGVGVAIKNGYGPTEEINLSGITCTEGKFAIYDKVNSSNERYPITIGKDEDNNLLTPKDIAGNAIDMSKGVRSFDRDYTKICFGTINWAICLSPVYFTTERYGTETMLFFPSVPMAQGFAESDDGEILNRSLQEMLLGIIYYILGIN